MRRKIVAGVGLVAVVLAVVIPPLMVLSVRASEPPLRKGMSEEEAARNLKACGYLWHHHSEIFFTSAFDAYYLHKPDVFGNTSAL